MNTVHPSIPRGQSMIGRVGVLDRYGHSGLDRELLKLYNLTTEDIVDKALEILNK